MFTNQCKLGNYGIDNKDAKSGHMGGNIVHPSAEIPRPAPGGPMHLEEYHGLGK